MAIISISAALIAVRFDHWLSGRSEYHKAISTVEDEIAVNISICELNCRLIDSDVNAAKEGRMSDVPYQGFRESAWSTWKSVILLRNPKVAPKIEEAYFAIYWANSRLRRIEEFKREPVPAFVPIAEFDSTEAYQIRHFEEAKRCISDILLPRLKEAEDLLRKES